MKLKGRTYVPIQELWKMGRGWFEYDEKTGVMTCSSCTSEYGQVCSYFSVFLQKKIQSTKKKDLDQQILPLCRSK